MKTHVLIRETVVCCAGGDEHRPLHTFDPLFFCKLAGANATGPYNFANVEQWVEEGVVGYNIFQCREWVFPIHLADRYHWVLVHVSLPDESGNKFVVRYFDSLYHHQNGKEAKKLRVRHMQRVYESITVKSLFNAYDPAPWGHAIPQCGYACVIYYLYTCVMRVSRI